MSFLPPAPHPVSAVVDIDAPPVVHSNPYVQQMPAMLLAEPKPPRAKTSGDSLVQKADAAFLRGKHFYQAGNIADARKELDTAVDLMLEASGENPAEREEYNTHMDEMVETIHRWDLAGMGAAAGVEQGRFEKAPLEDILQMTFPVDPSLKARVRDQVASTVSQLPLSVNDTVLGYINYFSNHGHRTIVAGIERSGKYRPMIQRILDEEGIPQELIHLAQAESGFIPRAVSRAAAGGMWQFLTWRGQQYGLMQTRYTDDRMDPEKATRAAAHHLHDLYNEFGDWYLAIAAYNCGPGTVEKAVERTGYADFWELRSRGVLPAETTNYVPIILAMTIMEKNAPEYGLTGLQLDTPLEYDTIEVTSSTSLSLIADILDRPVSELAALNPAVLRGMTPDNYSIHVPKGTGNQLVASLQLIPAGHRDSWRMHRVTAGETLASIAKAYGTSAGVISSANNLQTGETAEGDRLLIPAVVRAETPVRTSAAHTSQSHTAPTHRVSTTVRRSKGKTPAKPSVALVPSHKPPVMVARTASR